VSCYAHFAPGHRPLQAQNVHNKTQSFYGQHEDVCLGTTNYIFDGKKGSEGGKKKYCLQNNYVHI
jgi:hypothetical protein